MHLWILADGQSEAGGGIATALIMHGHLDSGAPSRGDLMLESKTVCASIVRLLKSLMMVRSDGGWPGNSVNPNTYIV